MGSPGPAARAALCLCAALASGAAAAVDSVLIRSRLDYNAVLITEVDIVFVYDRALLEDFPATKEAWYSGRPELVRRAGGGMDVVSVFVPQGFDSAAPGLPARRGGALRVYAFGRHDVPGRPPLDVTGIRDVLVEIDPFGILVSARRGRRGDAAGAPLSR